MKLIGLLGGANWPSTAAAYRLINELVAGRTQERHSARALIYSMDYPSLKRSYGQWDVTRDLLANEIERLLDGRPDCWMIANNTLHKAYDLLASAPATVPMMHAVRLTEAEVAARNVRQILLVGTKLMMDDPLYIEPLCDRGVDVRLPNTEDRELLQNLQATLAKGGAPEPFAASLSSMLALYASEGCEAVVVACTELPDAIRAQAGTLLVIDPMELQCRSCVDFALTP